MVPKENYTGIIATASRTTLLVVKNGRERTWIREYRTTQLPHGCVRSCTDNFVVLFGGVYMHTHSHTHTHTHTQPHTHTQHTRRHTHRHTHTQTDTHIHSHTDTHTHTYTRTQLHIHSGIPCTQARKQNHNSLNKMPIPFHTEINFDPQGPLFQSRCTCGVCQPPLFPCYQHSMHRRLPWRTKDSFGGPGGQSPRIQQIAPETAGIWGLKQKSEHLGQTTIVWKRKFLGQNFFARETGWLPLPIQTMDLQLRFWLSEDFCPLFHTSFPSTSPRTDFWGS